jgi:hypothetical protein
MVELMKGSKERAFGRRLVAGALAKGVTLFGVGIDRASE